MCCNKKMDPREIYSSWQSALESFLLEKRGEGKSERTLYDYETHVKRFFKAFPQAYQPERARRSVLEYLGAKMSVSTYNLRLQNLKVFYGWCFDEGIFPENPAQKIRKRKNPGRIVEISVQDIRRLLECPDVSTFTGLRDYALMLLSLDSGIRPNEALNLLTGDIEIPVQEIKVRAETAKSRSARILPISSETAKNLRKLMNARLPRWDDTVPVFCTYEGEKMQVNGWYHRVNGYARRIGKKIRPYDLRHTFALNFVRNDGNVLALQKIMGHADISMTKKYVALSAKDLHDQHSIASPVRKLFPKKQRNMGLK